MANRIPRKFNLIVGKMLIKTSCNQENDIVHITKREQGGYLSFNTRTKEYCRPSVEMLRISEVFEIVKVEV